MNKIFLMGRLTSDVELKTTTNGLSVTSFCLAVDRKKRKDEEKSATDFIQCVCFGKTAETVAKYFSKGSPIICIGSLQIEVWKDKDGNNRKTAKVVVDDFHFCAFKKDENKQPLINVPFEEIAAEIRGKNQRNLQDSIAESDPELPF